MPRISNWSGFQLIFKIPKMHIWLLCVMSGNCANTPIEYDGCGSTGGQHHTHWIIILSVFHQKAPWHCVAGWQQSDEWIMKPYWGVGTHGRVLILSLLLPDSQICWSAARCSVWCGVHTVQSWPAANTSLAARPRPRPGLLLHSHTQQTWHRAIVASFLVSFSIGKNEAQQQSSSTPL